LPCGNCAPRATLPFHILKLTTMRGVLIDFAILIMLKLRRSEKANPVKAGDAKLWVYSHESG
jgi:hypothetical protein